MENTEPGIDKAICVFSSSSNEVSASFFEVARELGFHIAREGYALVYGGTRVGLMGAIAEAVHQYGGKVIGVIPEALHRYGIAYDLADELIITKDLRERKATMEARASAFIGFPGGFGTIEEIFEMLTLKQLKYHEKPLTLLNVDGFFDPLLELFDHFYRHRFAKEEVRDLYHITDDVRELFRYLETYRPPVIGTKWD